MQASYHPFPLHTRSLLLGGEQFYAASLRPGHSIVFWHLSGFYGLAGLLFTPPVMSGLKLAPLLIVDVQHLQQPDEDCITFYEGFFIQCCDEVVWGGGGRQGDPERCLMSELHLVVVNMSLNCVNLNFTLCWWPVLTHSSSLFRRVGLGWGNGPVQGRTENSDVPHCHFNKNKGMTLVWCSHCDSFTPL